jgi:hypothetical protein
MRTKEDLLGFDKTFGKRRSIIDHGSGGHSHGRRQRNPPPWLGLILYLLFSVGTFVLFLEVLEVFNFLWVVSVVMFLAIP